MSVGSNHESLWVPKSIFHRRERERASEVNGEREMKKKINESEQIYFSHELMKKLRRNWN
jgi:hypothetical protein